MGAGSRRKGKTAEREVAKMLESWWGQVEPGCRFKPTPMSGGWSAPDVRGEFGTAGDLVTTAKTWPWCVEVKRREGWTMKNVVAGKPSPVWGWWAQACKAAVEAGKNPILFFRKNNEEWYILLPDYKWSPRLTTWAELQKEDPRMVGC